MAGEQLERIGELLIEEGVVTQDELSRAIAESGIKGTLLASVLEGCKHTRRAELAAFLANDFRVPKIDDLRKVEFRQDAIRTVPADLARKHEFVPLAKVGPFLTVAKPNYFNRAAVQDIRRASGMRVKILQADEGQVKAAIEKFYGAGGDIPAPKASKVATAAFRAVPATVDEARAREAVPLFSMPGGAPSAAAEAEPIEIVAAAKIPAAEFENERMHPHALLVTTWDDLFLEGRPVQPIQVG